MSAGAADKSKRPQRKAVQLKPQPATATNSTNAVEELPDNNITIIQVSNTDSINAERQPPELPPKNKIIADIFRFPEINAKVKTKTQPTSKSPSQQKIQNDYKSNVQIIPSNSNTIQVLSQPSSSNNASGNPYTIPLKANASNASNQNASTSAVNANTNTTTVQVLAEPGEATTVAVYGTCYPTSSGQRNVSKPPTPKVSKKIILSANSSGITNIRINNEQAQDANVISGNVHYEKVFLSSSIPISSGSSSGSGSGSGREERPTGSQPQTQSPNAIVSVANTPISPATTSGSPALPRRAISISSPGRGKPQQLTRGLTELVISTRPSRRDFHYLKLLNTPLKTQKTAPKESSTANTNNNMEQISGNTPSSSGTTSAAVSSTVENIEQRRRSSSTSDAQAPLQRGATVAASTQTPVNGQRGANNNEFVPGRSAAGNAFRMQSPPQVATPATGGNKRLTLREQQVMQLRREIMHPGGVRLNLRRKDCVGSIAWVDAFGGVW